MVFYLATLLAGAISPVFPVVSIEAWVVFVGVFGERPSLLVSLSAATGQLLCFVLLYHFGARAVLRLPFVVRKLDRFEPARYAVRARYFVCSASLVGLPPMNLMSVVAPGLGVKAPLFTFIAFTGRAFRLSVLVVFASAVRDYFPVEAVPEFLRALL